MAKKPKKPNWEKIATEYITGDIGQVKLAQKHGVPLRTLQDRCRAEGWVAQKKAHRGATVAKAVEKISEEQADQMAVELTAAAGELLAMVRTGIKALNRPVRGHTETIEQDGITTRQEWTTLDEPDGQVDMRGAKAAANALRDVYAILGLKTELERQEQEARIAALRAKAAQADGNEPGEIAVTFDAGPEEWNE